MAKNPPKGSGRVGAVKKRAQAYNPHNKRWTKINTDNNLFMDQAAAKNKHFKGVRKHK